MSAIQDHQRPAFLRGVRLKHDAVRGNWVLLAPERAIPLDAIGHAILEETDGARSLSEIVARLAEKYNAPPERIAEDSRKFLEALIARRFMEAT